MVLKVQIISLVVSFCYGIFFYLLLELNSRFLYSSHIVVRIIVSFLFVMFHTLLYFLILMKINYGYIHFYFFLCIFIAFPALFSCFLFSALLHSIRLFHLISVSFTAFQAQLCGVSSYFSSFYPF